MHVLEVIPLSRTAPPEPLSYRSRTALAPGTLVEVSLRRQTVFGLVLSSEPVRDAKATLKNAAFVLSKSVPKEYGKLPGALLRAARAVAEYHAASIGSTLAALLTSVLTEEIVSDLPRLNSGSGFTEERCEAPLVERQRAYEKRLSAAGTTLLVVPTIAEARAYAERFKSQKPLVLSSALSPKKRDAALRAAAEQTGSARPIIATPGFAFVPIPKLANIIIERVSAGSYVLPKRPYLDMRIALTELARERKVPITYGDYPLPLEYRAKARMERPPAQAPAAAVTLIDARSAQEERAARGEGSSWQAIPDEARNAIAAALAQGGTVGVLAVRRGYAPTVICRDCGTAVTDEYGRALSFAIVNGERLFRSADGRTIEKVGGKKVLCKNCGSWNLLPLGVGVERVVEELRAAFPDAPLTQIDADTVNAKTLKELAAPAAGGRLIVGTELMLPWLSLAAPAGIAPLALGIIASADSLLALPFWRARERFARVGLMLAERSERLIVVTRQPEEIALTAISHPTASHFWKEESSLRRLLHYPPFGTLIVFHAEGNAASIAKAQEYIRTACAPHTFITLPERAISKSQARATSVLHLPARSWPDPELSKKLAQLPLSVRIHIDSETLW